MYRSHTGRRIAVIISTAWCRTGTVSFGALSNECGGWDWVVLGLCECVDIVADGGSRRVKCWLHVKHVLQRVGGSVQFMA